MATLVMGAVQEANRLIAPEETDPPEAGVAEEDISQGKEFWEGAAEVEAALRQMEHLRAEAVVAAVRGMWDLMGDGACSGAEAEAVRHQVPMVAPVTASSSSLGNGGTHT